MRKRTRKRIINLWYAIGLSFILGALYLIAYNLTDQNRADKAVNDILAELEPFLEEKKSEVYKKQSSIPDLMVSSETSFRIEEVIPDYVLNPQKKMPVKVVDGQPYIGILSIPELDLKLPVMEAWDYERLRNSPCLYAGSVYLNNAVICAHNYNKHFGRLKYLSVGSQISFLDADGNIFNYSVVEIEALRPTEVQSMISGDWDLTLFTCTIGGATRVTVRCELLNSKEGTMR